MAAVNFRTSKLERLIRRWEAKLAVMEDPARREQLKENIAELKHEFDLNKKESEKDGI